MFLRDVGHIGEYYGKGDGKDTRHGDDSEVPPKTKDRLLVR